MADGAGYDLPHEASSLISVARAIELLEAGETFAKLRVDIGESYVVEMTGGMSVPDLLQRLRGHAGIVALASQPGACDERAEAEPTPVLHPKVADILDALA
ncbi:MAG: hypothetical protein AAF768_04445 [Pseudomonadota bacterium]